MTKVQNFPIISYVYDQMIPVSEVSDICLLLKLQGRITRRENLFKVFWGRSF